MRVLHLYSNYVWTGPSEPVVNLARALRDDGIDVHFACCRTPSPRPRSVYDKAAERGLEPILDFHLTKLISLDGLRDIGRMSTYLEDHAIDIVHTHRPRDHGIGAYAAHRCCRPVRVVRTNHTGVPLKKSWLLRHTFRRYTDAYLGFSRQAAVQDQQVFDVPENRVFLIDPALDLDRFDPSRTYPDIRPQLSLSSGHVLVGIIARAQRHRRWEVLLAAMKLAVERAPQLRLLIIGKGTHFDTAVRQPVNDMGLNDCVRLPGYRTDDYVTYLSNLDFKIFLMPGTDGTCRAAREAMAMGKPVIAARRGMLPELVAHEETGLVIDDTPEQLAEAMVRLANDTNLRKRLSKGARQYALDHFRLKDQSKAVIAMYEQLMRDK
jgi:glycosyltransferase involved in cell wall biosynthesis